MLLVWFYFNGLFFINGRTRTSEQDARTWSEWSDCQVMSIYDCGKQYRRTRRTPNPVNDEEVKVQKKCEGAIQNYNTQHNLMSLDNLDLECPHWEWRGCMHGSHWKVMPNTDTWFKFSPSEWSWGSKRSFYSAQQSCTNFGAQLASITSEEEHVFIQNNIDKRCWQIGLVRLYSYPNYTTALAEGKPDAWQWLDGQSKTYPVPWHRIKDPRQWKWDEPNDGAQSKEITFESEACIKSSKMGDVYDFNTDATKKSAILPFICKKRCTINYDADQKITDKYMSKKKLLTSIKQRKDTKSRLAGLNELEETTFTDDDKENQTDDNPEEQLVEDLKKQVDEDLEEQVDEVEEKQVDKNLEEQIVEDLEAQVDEKANEMLDKVINKKKLS
jgi:hypothetical protein